MARKLLLAFLCCCGLLRAQDVGTVPKADPPLYALSGATIVVGNGQTLTNATLVVKDGLIEAVGQNVAVPAGAWKLDVSGMFIYPGFIDALSNTGFEGASAEPRQRGQAGAPNRNDEDENREGPGYFAHIEAADHLDIDDKKLSAWREAGILALNVRPDEGIFRGTTALINVNGSENADQMIVRPNVAMDLSFDSLRGTYPASLMGVLAHIRQTFLDAQHYQLAHNAYDKNKRGFKRPETDRTMNHLLPVIDGQMPVIFPAKQEREIRRALAIRDDFNLKAVIAGGFEAGPTADLLKKADVPVLVSLNFPAKAKDQHPDSVDSLTQIRYRLHALAAAAELQQAGVKFAFYSDGLKTPGDFLKNLRKTVENGLSSQDAVRAATLSAAEILGVSDQLGSLEAGKIANLIVADRDLLDEKARLKQVFVDGIRYEVSARPKKPADAGKGSAESVGGSWDVTITTPDRTESMTLELSQDGETVTGEVKAQRGNLAIYDGSFTGNQLHFKFQMNLEGTPVEVTVSAEVSEGSMNGTASLPQVGSAPLEGRRIPQS